VDECKPLQVGRMRGGLVQRETALQRWALSLSKVGRCSLTLCNKC